MHRHLANDTKLMLQTSVWPDLARLKQLEASGQLSGIIIENDGNAPKDLPVDPFAYMAGDGDGYRAWLFGGRPAFMPFMLAEAERFMAEDMLPIGAVGNEQMFFFLWKMRNSSVITDEFGDLFWHIAKQQ